MPAKKLPMFKYNHNSRCQSKVVEVQVSVKATDVPTQVTEAIFQPFDIQDQTLTYMIYRWVCGGVLKQKLQ